MSIPKGCQVKVGCKEEEGFLYIDLKVTKGCSACFKGMGLISNSHIQLTHTE